MDGVTARTLRRTATFTGLGQPESIKVEEQRPSSWNARGVQRTIIGAPDSIISGCRLSAEACLSSVIASTVPELAVLQMTSHTTCLSGTGPIC